MADLDVEQTQVTNLTNTVEDFMVDSQSLDAATHDETPWDFPNASRNIGYYKEIPELKKAIDSLAIWTTGKGWTSEIDEPTLNRLTGSGEQTFQNIMWNMIVMKKVIGDSFAEIIRNSKGTTLINLRPISAERMRVIYNEDGVIKRYEVKKTDKTWEKFQPENILHLSNDRVGDEIHGTSVIDACKWVIDARNESLSDARIVFHRNAFPARIIEVDSEDPDKINAVIKQYENAIKKGEVIVVPKGTVTVTDSTITIQDPIAWISYLENFFYQAVGIPRVIATSEGFTEAGGKIGFLTFEPIYTAEQKMLEADIWNQLAIRVKFNRPPSLDKPMQEEEQKNAGQVGFQSNDVTAGVGE